MLFQRVWPHLHRPGRCFFSSQASGRPGRECTLMVVMADKKGTTDELMAAVPAPTSKSHLKSMGILILNYAAHEQSHCCKAHRILGENKGAESVEFDGPAPEC